MTLSQTLQTAIAERTLRVTVCGLGAVGLPLVRLLVEAGFHVRGIDTDAARVAELQAGVSPLGHLPGAWVRTLNQTGRVTWGGTQDAVASAPEDEAASVGIICVPTPIDAQGGPDLGPLRTAAQTLANTLQKPALVLLESTTYPGTTREEVWPVLREQGFELGETLAIAFAPERVNPGHGDAAARHTPRLVGGLDENSTELARQFYETLGFEVRATSLAEVAEAAKLVENVYRAVNIALVNELKLSFKASNIDIWEVLDAADSKSFGFQRFDPGPGAGGSCIPVDPRYLEYFARAAGEPARLVELAGEIDRGMAQRVVDVLVDGLQSQGKSLRGAHILLCGVAYKADVGITTESPSLRIAGLLLAQGALVSYHDSWVPGPIEWSDGSRAFSVELDESLLKGQDACLYLTDHANMPLDRLAEWAQLIVDTRGKGELQVAGSRYRRA